MKRIVSVLLALMLMLTLFTGTALADRKDDREARRLYQMVDMANAKIDVYVRIAQITPCNDVAWLLRKVDQTTAPVFRYADRIGALVACEYDYYWIDGQYVAIDPLHVIHV